ncbi:site-2 protease family protein [Octadecabacter sp. 1_MG-2023]|uniref:metalloprotease n=1 Tax=unclassified Octadecabacter TaxID=196158 RepID=UPI001C0A3D62|nr:MULTISPECIES: site-2 protease family protein [unclassified Octadecabacter]MBU2994532.1 site-2 protease family protein [Octadecabacter sp. B2R22]MDO6734175.1 site-2 protease family protein [Octadecabacter sp. 1_MG-2023]
MSGSVTLLAGIIACLATAYALRGGLVSRTKMTVLGMDPQGIGVSILAVILAVFLFGPVFGLSLILVVVIHEFGHVAAFRVAGHDDARFRLVPLLGGYAISNREPDTQEESVFITLMGPAICIAPMVLAYGLAGMSINVMPAAYGPLMTFASICGALNFFNLLPIWPLDGGRLTASITSVFHDRAPFYIFATSAALIGLVALLSQRIFLIFIVLMTVQHMMQTGGGDGRAPYRRMSKKRALLCLGAWLFTAAALFVGGQSTILRFI